MLDAPDDITETVPEPVFTFRRHVIGRWDICGCGCVVHAMQACSWPGGAVRTATHWGLIEQPWTYVAAFCVVIGMP
jgi:hypothetical protein